MGRIHNIEGRKNKQDSKRAKVFTKLGRYIMVAAREGGGDPAYNASLKTAIEKAKAEDMPNDNIERAIKKGVGGMDGEVFTELTYEGYGPGGIAVLVECLTDKTNRTAADVRSYFSKANGNLGTNGCVSFMFDRRGILAILKTDGMDDDEMMMQALEAGAEDVIIEDDHYEVITAVEDFTGIRDTLATNYKFEMAELSYLPQTMTKLTSDEDIKNMQKLIDLMEDHDDVQNIYHNWEE